MKILFKGGQWSNAEDEILKAAVMKYGKNNWGRVASLITRKSADQCKGRYEEYLAPTINRGEWSREEEAALLELREAGHAWRLIASQIPGRTAAQCLDHHTLLVDRARGEATGDTATQGAKRQINFSEQDMSWETRAPRADTMDADNYEKDMLDAARGRLANTKGKKDLRKQREQQLAEAKQRAALQKQRELLEAGIGRAAATGALDDDDDGAFETVHVDSLDPQSAKHAKRSAQAEAAAARAALATLESTTAEALLQKRVEEEAKRFVAFASSGTRLTSATGALTITATSVKAREVHRQLAGAAGASASAAPSSTAHRSLGLPTLRPVQATVKAAPVRCTSDVLYAQLCGIPPIPAAALNIASSLFNSRSDDATAVNDVATTLLRDELVALAGVAARCGAAFVASSSSATPAAGPSAVGGSKKIFSEDLQLSQDDPRLAALRLIDEECARAGPTSLDGARDRVARAIQNAATPTAEWGEQRLRAELDALAGLAKDIALQTSTAEAADLVGRPFSVLHSAFVPRTTSAFGVASAAEHAAAEARAVRVDFAAATDQLVQSRLEHHVYTRVLIDEQREIRRRGLGAALAV